MSAPVGHAERLHELKVWPPYFDALADGSKTFEVRKNDRGFKVGDTLRLREWSHATGYTGREVTRLITYVLESDLWCLPHTAVLGLTALDELATLRARLTQMEAALMQLATHGDCRCGDCMRAVGVMVGARAVLTPEGT